LHTTYEITIRRDNENLSEEKIEDISLILKIFDVCQLKMLEEIFRAKGSGNEYII
jgi:hypothetical protein